MERVVHPAMEVRDFSFPGTRQIKNAVTGVAVDLMYVRSRAVDWIRQSR